MHVPSPTVHVSPLPQTLSTMTVSVTSRTSPSSQTQPSTSSMPGPSSNCPTAWSRNSWDVAAKTFPWSLRSAFLSGYHTAAIFCIPSQQKVPYSGTLSREKTFADFAVLWLFAKILSAKFGGVSILARHENRIFYQFAKVFSLESFPLYGMLLWYSTFHHKRTEMGCTAWNFFVPLWFGCL